MEIKTKGVVLGRTFVGEKDAIIKILTECAGVVSASAKLTLPEGYTDEAAPTDPPADPTDPTEAPAGDPGTAEPAPNNTWIIIVAAVAVVAVVAVVIVVKKKK